MFRNQLRQLSKMLLRKGNITAASFDDNFFDFVYTANTVYFWDSLEEGYYKVLRTLKTGGVLANIFYSAE